MIWRLSRDKGKKDADGFYKTDIAPGDVLEGSLRTLRLGQELAVLTRYEGALYAFSHVCPHAAADLGKGRLRNGRIKCPDHGYTFDVRNGRATWPPDEGCQLTRFAVRVEGGCIRIKVP